MTWTYVCNYRRSEGSDVPLPLVYVHTKWFNHSGIFWFWKWVHKKKSFLGWFRMNHHMIRIRQIHYLWKTGIYIYSGCLTSNIIPHSGFRQCSDNILYLTISNNAHKRYTMFWIILFMCIITYGQQTLEIWGVMRLTL